MAGPSVASHSKTSGAGEPERSGGGKALFAMVLSAMMLVAISVILAPQLVTLSKEFKSPVNNVIWTLIIVTIINAPIGGLAGGLGRRYGAKRLLMGSILCIGLGAVICALAKNLGVLIAGRALEGIGGGIFACVFAIVGTYWSGHKMRVALGWVMASSGMVVLFIYPLSAYVEQYGGHWRYLFWGVAVVSLLCMLAVGAWVNETPREKVAKLDYIGAIGIIAWAILILLPLSKANDWGFGSSKFLGMFIPGVVILIGWTFWELSVSNPLLDLRTLLHHGVGQGIAMFCGISMAGVGMMTTLAWIVQTPSMPMPGGQWGFGKNILWLGWILAASGVGAVVGANLFGPVVKRLSLKGTMLMGSVFCSSFLLAAAFGKYLWIFPVCCFLYGLVVPTGGSAAVSLMLEAVPPEKAGHMGSVVNVVQAISGAIAGALIGFILTFRTLPVPGVKLPTGSMFTWSFLIMGLSGVVVFLLVLLVKPHKLATAERTVHFEIETPMEVWTVE
jgi:MFS family permease